MATRKMTFSLPEQLVAELIKRVPARNRSHYVAGALSRQLRERDRLLARAAEVANRSRAVKAVEKEMEALGDELAEPWDDTPAR
jgi:metal-responsive CopG/Arc/MetJ family transcriptional regulator